MERSSPAICMSGVFWNSAGELDTVEGFVEDISDKIKNPGPTYQIKSGSGTKSNRHFDLRWNGKY